ncbi:MAG TPA: helix-turn-helix domain-containing protein, partial [Polyangiaceae bacterium]|nr:helix-turn-helix domain-containing protein [Polyangiaceae bacterium]
MAPPLGVKHVIAVGGGRGGVGKSIVAVNLAVYLAQLGRKVLLIDTDPAGAELHTALGLGPPSSPPSSTSSTSGTEDAEEDDLTAMPTQVPGLSLVPQLYRAGSTVPVRPGRKARWARSLKNLEADYVLLDLGAGTLPATLDLFLTADFGICVSVPEPPAIEATYRFVRAAFVRALRRALVKDRFKLRLVERAEAELGPLPAPSALVHTLARYDTNLAQLAANELSRIRPRLVVNGARLRADTELGNSMSDLARRHLGVNFDYVGHIEQDDAVWLSVVHQRPVLIDNPTSKGARNLERIARRILALAANRDQERQGETVPLSPAHLNLYEVLLAHRGATDEELRRAYKRQRDLYQPNSLPLTSLLRENEQRRESARIEEAHDTLLDPLRRKAYDASVFPAEQAELPKRNAALDSALEAERSMLQKELAREINGETEFTGTLLRKVRESQGIELSEIAKLTKISSTHLQAIEAERYAELPALVYTRGFVQQLAKF